MSTAATHLLDPASDELIREARARYEAGRSEQRARWLLALPALAVAAGIALCAVLLHGGPSFSVGTAMFFLILYAAVSRVEFEIGTGSAIPTELVLVPMLFALPIGLVPAIVAGGLLLRTVVDRPWPLREPAGLFAHLGTAAHSFGPTLVIALAGGLPLRWTAWPIYVAALAAQLAFDFGNALVNAQAYRIALRTLVGFVGMAYAVDAALAPIGLAIAFAMQGHTALALLPIPLVLLLRSFASERRQRIGSALELSDAYRGTSFLLGEVIEADDAYTGSHSRHVVELVLDVAKELRLSPREQREAEFVALLHDVGKIRVPNAVLNKPGPLDDEELALVRRHTIDGEEMLARIGGLLGDVGRIVRSCHERWDGEGYPDRLAGEQIPLLSRIVGVCDAYSAMTTDRPYRAAFPESEALAEVARCSGSQFDPRVVAALISVVG